ncbi:MULTISPECIES: metallophosphoesterase [Vagococcus]|uniref:Phosphoesterase n=1 Tax=Vagococcus fluvialis bH819 TaxID=1255619 RepID=A0A1X6WR37_9ENTE|nr:MULTISPECIES: metallophosphoesterase [Vagococcus]SLM86718.1 phosphoesterase [Vagococcus fluvialis bH819]HCM90926.1 metallophosphoesterase [Vagococcus sp.]
MKLIKTLSIASLLLGGALLAEGYRENRQLDKEFFTVKSTKLNKNSDKIRIAHLSDTQFPRLKIPKSKILNTLTNEAPDIILFTGDTIDRTENIETTELSLFLNKLTKIAPTFVISGNHEVTNDGYSKWLDIVTNSHAVYLNNEVTKIKIRDNEFNVVGISNGNTTLSAMEKEKINPNLETFVLAHHPEKIQEYISDINQSSINVFSGHAHGGQVILPGVGGLFSPDQGFLPDYTNGHYQIDKNNLFVSRGLANSSFPVRLNNYPHLLFIDIEGK